MAGKFEVYKDKAGEFRFRLKSGTGAVLLASEGYGTRDKATSGIESVRVNAAKDGRYEVRESRTGRVYYNLRSQDGRTIGTIEKPEGLTVDYHKIVDWLGSTAREADVVDMTALEAD